MFAKCEEFCNGELMSSLIAEFTKFLDELCVKNNVECGHPRTAARMLDKV